MSTATDDASRRRGPPARSMVGWAVRMGGASVVLLGLLGWGIAMQAPAVSPADDAPATAARDSGGGLFYHPTNHMSYRAGPDGRFHIEGTIGGHHIEFVFNAAIAAIVLRRDDVRAAGVDMSKLDFSATIAGLGNDTRVAPVTVPMITFRNVTLFNVKAVVADGYLANPILGTDFLRRFDSYDLHEDEIALRW